MRFQHILQAVYAEPWLIKPSAHAIIREYLDRRLAGNEPPKREDGMDICGEAVSVEQPELVDNVYVIPVGGIIARKLGALERGIGAVDTLDIRRELDWAEDSRDVRGVVLDFDSPGGIVTGTPELADRIAAFEKTLFAFTGSMMDSAAYWLASGADRIFSTRSADVGSIGVYVPYLDQSARYTAEGLSVELFRSGKFKGMGYPGTSLTDAQREQLQREVDGIANEFKTHVWNNRPNVPEEAMQGQSFTGTEASANGLVDELVSEINDVIAMV